MLVVNRFQAISQGVHDFAKLVKNNISCASTPRNATTLRRLGASG